MNKTRGGCVSEGKPSHPMKTIAFLLFAATGLGLGSARADRVDIHANVNFGAPVYQAPGYYSAPAPVYVAPPPNGYWRNVTESVWIAPHWEMRRDAWGRPYRYLEPGRYERRPRRVWVDAHAHRSDHYRRDERANHDRWDHDRRDRDRHDNGWHR